MSKMCIVQHEGGGVKFDIQAESGRIGLSDSCWFIPMRIRHNHI